jgi:hypothetical protein
VAQVKGSTVTARIRFVRERWGEDGWRALKTALDPATRAAVETRVLPHDWFPYEAFIELNVGIDRLYGTGDLALCYEMGRYGAEVNLPTLYRIFFRFGSPMYLFEKAARLWQVNYDSGRLVPVAEGPSEIRLRIEDFESPHRAHCLSVLGWASRAIELTGAKVQLADEGLCRTRGDEACEMSLKWR